eukprot:PhF_6_TR6064/c0_g1_i1/m.8792
MSNHVFTPVRAKLHLCMLGCTAQGNSYTGFVNYTLRVESADSSEFTETASPTSNDEIKPFQIHFEPTLISLTNIRASQGKRALKVKSCTPTLEFQDGCELSVGDIELVLTFTGKVAKMEEEPVGLYPCDALKNTTLVTFFEVAHARRCFPCFDDTSCRIPWSFSMELEPARSVLWNTEPKSTSTSTRMEFEDTPPLPTYLLGFVISPEGFTTTSAEDTTHTSSCVVYVPKKLSYPPALQVAQWGLAALKQCNEYFASIPLDVLGPFRIVIVPRMHLGGMETHGLIMLNGKDTLGGTGAKSSSKGGSSGGGNEALCKLVVHEVVHHWAGNMIGFPFVVKEGLANYYENIFGDVVLGKNVGGGGGTAKKKSGGESSGAKPQNDLSEAEAVDNSKVFTGQVYTRSLNEVQAVVARLGEREFQRLINECMEHHLYQLVSTPEWQLRFGVVPS